MIHLDGSQGEGGGQMVRTALALSTLTGQPFRMTRIRANRPRGGLKAQHLRAVEALRAIAGARIHDLHDLRVGAEELVFIPGPVKPGAYHFEIGTAGSIALLLQALLPPLLFAPGASELLLTGGTCGRWQPSVAYTRAVLLPYLTRLAKIELEILREGYFPKGGGEVKVRIDPVYPSWQSALQALPPYDLTTAGPPLRFGGVAFAAEQLRERNVAERMAEGARAWLAAWDHPVAIDIRYGPAYNAGAGICLWADLAGDPPGRLGADALGERGKPAETVGREAAERLNHALGSDAPVDEYLADQLVPFLALAPGSRLRAPRASGHFLSNIDITRRFLPVDFRAEGRTFEVIRRP